MTGKDFPGGSFGDALKDGTVLCAVINSMIPGSIPNVNTSSMAFKQVKIPFYFFYFYFYFIL